MTSARPQCLSLQVGFGELRVGRGTLDGWGRLQTGRNFVTFHCNSHCTELTHLYDIHKIFTNVFFFSVYSQKVDLYHMLYYVIPLFW